jgi:Mg2+-importing ATPase
MTFLGFLLFTDPPKEGIDDSVRGLHGLGVELKVMTGDNRRVAAHLAREIGLAAEPLLTGVEIDRLRPEALARRVAEAALFAELEPQHKERLLRALKGGGRVVGFLGDGINDAPALHVADVGISVDSAVDVAKQAADFVLLRPDLGVLQEGIAEGRRTFANTMKYVFVTSSANFGNMVSMAIASAGLPFLPLLAKQILLNNFLTDVPAVAIAGDGVDAELVQRPRRWDLRLVRDFMVAFGLVSSVFDLLLFALLVWVVRAAPATFRSAWFVESALTEVAVMLVLRTRRPFYRSRPGRLLAASSAAVAAGVIALPYVPRLGPLLGFVPLPLPLLGGLVLVTLLYVAASEASKRGFYRRHPA